MRQQSADYAGARSRQIIPALLREIPGANHFSILDEMERSDGLIVDTPCVSCKQRRAVAGETRREVHAVSITNIACPGSTGASLSTRKRTTLPAASACTS